MEKRKAGNDWETKKSRGWAWRKERQEMIGKQRNLEDGHGEKKDRK